ncbi:MAG: hypothetical protein CVU89_11630 [Firmicutes bacterium HGW-Firmicutes-14]|nr:MAG: hypothetical protein CVU89_11630 [Firmicutes bacterium HGW-Firmicutes-14]
MKMSGAIRYSGCRLTAGRAAAAAVIAGIYFLLFNIPVMGAGQMEKPAAEATSKQVFYLTFGEELDIGSVTITNIKVYSEGTRNPLAMVSLMPDRKVVRGVLETEMEAGSTTAPVYYWVYIDGVANAAKTSTLVSNNSVNIPAPGFEAFNPHGKYSPSTYTKGNGTRLCGLCHLAHSAGGRRLLNGENIQRVCFVCHGPDGVRPEGLSEPDWTLAVNVYHEFEREGSIHKSLADTPNNALTCVDCHNPHGDRIPGKGNSIYPKLLKSTLNGTSYFSGNEFCFTCHGETDRAFTGDITYWTDTGGSHGKYYYYDLKNNAVHYDIVVRDGAMLPPSGTQVTCIMCHDRHGSRFDSLVNDAVYDTSMAKNNINQACFACHGNGANYSLTGGYNVYERFTDEEAYMSRHNIFDPAFGLSCTSCHGPHSVDNVKYRNSTALTLSAISNPYNTKEPYNKGLGRYSGFCISCHNQNPPEAVTDSSAIIPSTITFIDPGFSANGSKWDKSGFTGSGHYNMPEDWSAKECSGCHEYHGTPYKWLTRANLDDTYYNSFTGDNSCFKTCHGNDVSPDVNTDVKTPYGKSYNHPTFTVNGVHSNTEDWESRNVERHAECADCHDVHTAGHGSDETSLNGEVTGVMVSDWNGAAWNNWGSTTPDWYLNGLTPASKQWQLCLKCHSKFSYDLVSSGGDLRAPHTNLTDTGYKQTDIAREFSPSNPAYHAVIGPAKMPPYGKFAGGWEYDSDLKCTDCHNNLGSGAKGPHGSSNRYILAGPWYPAAAPSGRGITGSGNGDSGDLCFQCHDYNFYNGTDNSADSQFAGWRPGQGGGGKCYHNNLHNDHVNKGCAKCHGGLPHGWKYTDPEGGGVALFISSDPFPYSEGLSATKPWKGVNGIPGDWQCTDCHGN